MMPARRLLVCGLGSGMERSLAELRALDLDLVVVTDRPEAGGLELASQVVTAYPRSESQVLDIVRRQVRGPIAGVFSLGYDNPVVVAALAEHFGTAGVPRCVALACTHKDVRIRRLKAGGVNVPRFAVVHSEEELRGPAEWIGFPLVIKPNDKTSSIGVRRVDSAHEFGDAFREASSWSESGTTVLEAYLEGSEHTFEGLVKKGEITITGISDRNYSRKEEFPPYFFEDGDTLPSSLTTADQEAIRHQIRLAVDALELDDSPFHCDVLLASTDRRPYLLEITCRLSGSRFGTELVPLSSGVSVLANAVRLALGDEMDPEEMRPTRQRAVVLRYLPSRGGKVRRVGSLDVLDRGPEIYDVAWEREIRPGEQLPRYTSGKDLLASVIATAPTVAEAEGAARRALARIPLEIEP